jgi:5'-methylthioadenosine phosphorylase
VRRLSATPPESEAHSALKYAILTPIDKISAAAKSRLGLLLHKYV